MKEGRPKIDGLILMDATFRGPEHPQGPAAEVRYALVQRREGGLATCGEIPYRLHPDPGQWPDRLRAAYLELVGALEEEALLRGGVFEEPTPEQEVVHAVVGRSEPEEF